MNQEKPRQLPDADALQARTTIQQLHRHFGLPVPEQTNGQLRVPCPFDEKCHTSSYGNLVINLDKDYKPFICHCCGRRGNFLKLAYFLDTREFPEGKLLRDKFRHAMGVLLSLHGESPPEPQPAAVTPTEKVDEPPVNIPLEESTHAGARATVTLDAQGIVDPAEMRPEAATLFRRRSHFLTPEACEKWRVCFLPRNAKSLFRGQIVYCIPDEEGRPLSWAARDPLFEQKRAEWETAGRPADKQPNKTRFVKGFHRGLETYGQNSEQRLQGDERLRVSLEEIGLVIVEGFHDAIRLDALGVYAEGLMSNRIANEQVPKIVERAKRLGGGRIVYLPDLNDAGIDGMKDTLAKLAAHCDVRLGWSSEQFAAGREPESITAEEWTDQLLPQLRR